MAKTKVNSPVKSCANKKKKDEANIVSVEFLNGSNSEILSDIGEQYVNLPGQVKFVDGKHVKNKDRLSNKPRIKVEFDKAGSHIFKIKLVPGGSNAIYSNTEKTRNGKFKFEDQQKRFATGPDGNKILSGNLFLAAAGNDFYSITAKDIKGKKVNSSGKLKTVRLIYLVEIKMRGLTSVAKNINKSIREYLNNYIKIKKLGSVSMDHIENISTGDVNSFQSKARKAYNKSSGKYKKPYCIAVAYTDHLAVKNPNKKLIKSNVEVGPPASPVIVPIQGPGLTNPTVKTRALWVNLVTGEDWFVSCKFKKSGLFSILSPSINIPKEKCTLIPSGSPGSYTKVSISVNHLSAAQGSLTLTVNWVDRMRAGLSFEGGNMICVCTRAWWQNQTTKSQNEVIIHEMGHKVGMVADGHGKLPDRVATQYDDSKGHVGSHCYYNLPNGQGRYDSDADKANSQCVMYGATNNKSAFCPNCKKAVRKIDISEGWSTF